MKAQYQTTHIGVNDMTKQITIHKITNGNGETVGWAVLRNKAEKLAEFDSIEAACAFADQQA